jgi:hypothetical protein
MWIDDYNYWLDELDDDTDDLFKEFDHELDKLLEKQISPDKQKRCWHTWELVGRSPVLDEPWYNCKKCGMKKEDYERSTKW